MIKLIIASVVLIACVAYLGYLFVKGLEGAGETYLPDEDKEDYNEN